ncbi:MAG TPA: magnesium transporter [Deltaproteobacteria bacterium]|nr:magnesium transporter [Deltaproteobacteria bacterium]
MIPRSFFLQLIEQEFGEFEDFLHQSTDREIHGFLAELHPADIADIVERLQEEDRTRVLGLLSEELAAEVLTLVEDHHKPEVLESIPEQTLSKIVRHMESDDVTDILEEMPREEAEEILEALPKQDSEQVRRLMSYPPDSAGGLMQTELIKVPPDFTLGQSIQRIREKQAEVGEILSVYVVNESEVLLGIIPLRTLILEDPGKKVSEVMVSAVISALVTMDQEQVAALFRKYDFISLPVVDAQSKLLGRILVDDVVDVIEEEASEDMYRLAGVDKEERVNDPPLRSIRLRLPWLGINLLTAILAASVVGFFQTTIQKVVVLAVFMPIVAGMGGNAGTQSLTVITRGIALGDLTFSNAKRVLFKEVLTGLMNGLLLGGLMAVLAFLYRGNPMLGVVIGLAMICNMFIAALAGTAVPLILKWAKVDPALASGVFVTTFTDVTGFFSFLGLATLFLRFLT